MSEVISGKINNYHADIIYSAHEVSANYSFIILSVSGSETCWPVSFGSSCVLFENVCVGYDVDFGNFRDGVNFLRIPMIACMSHLSSFPPCSIFYSLVIIILFPSPATS